MRTKTSGSHTSNRQRGFAFLVMMMLVLSACGKGPDLRAAVSKADIGASSPLPTLTGIDQTNSDAIWTVDGTKNKVADAIVVKEKPDERVDHANGEVFLLYKSGTLWVTTVDGSSQTAVVLYEDNDKAYKRHNVILIGSRGWGSRVNSYRSSGSGSSNGFRGGGSSSGK